MQAYLVVWGFALLLFRAVAFVYKLKTRPSTGKRILTHFIVTLILWRWSGRKSRIPLRYACTH